MAAGLAHVRVPFVLLRAVPPVLICHCLPRISSRQAILTYRPVQFSGYTIAPQHAVGHLKDAVA